VDFQQKKLLIRPSIVRGEAGGATDLKTEASYRAVDMLPTVEAALRDQFGGREGGLYVVSNAWGGPLDVRCPPSFYFFHGFHTLGVYLHPHTARKIPVFTPKLSSNCHWTVVCPRPKVLSAFTPPWLLTAWLIASVLQKEDER
jgi:hypothetical protein